MTTLLDTGIMITVILAFVLIIWSRITNKTITETLMEIKEIFGVIKGE